MQVGSLRGETLRADIEMTQARRSPALTPARARQAGESGDSMFFLIKGSVEVPLPPEPSPHPYESDANVSPHPYESDALSPPTSTDRTHSLPPPVRTGRVSAGRAAPLARNNNYCPLIVIPAGT